jgi:hypothetical protein
VLEELSVSGLTLFYGDEGRDAVEPVRKACERSVSLIQEHWGLGVPKDCRVYIMSSLLGFVFQSAPWKHKIILVVTLPLWYFRERRVWPYVGGYERRYGGRRVVGVKPPRLIALGKSTFGDRIFIKIEDPSEKVQSITCHELVHAFTSHLPLPTWLKEGLAMLTVDRYFDKPMARQETLGSLQNASRKVRPGGSEQLDIEDQDATIYQYVRGYWLTRFLEETQPGLLKGLLSQGLDQKQLEGKIVVACGKSPAAFWDEIDGLILSHFTTI